MILYELLCGVTPYRADSTDDLLAAVRSGQPRLPVEINPSVPPALQAIALKAMERHPADRYQTAAEMVRDFDRYLAGQPVRGAAHAVRRRRSRRACAPTSIRSASGCD